MRGNDLTDGERLVLLALADNADDEGICWPKVSTIASRLDRSSRTIRKRMSELEDKGYLERSQRRRDNGSMTSNLFRLPLPPEARDQLPRSSDKDWRMYFLLVDDRVKIGISANVQNQVAKARATGGRVKLLGERSAEKEDEQVFHDKLQSDRLRGEWFRWTPRVREEVAKYLQTTGGTHPSVGHTGSAPELKESVSSTNQARKKGDKEGEQEKKLFEVDLPDAVEEKDHGPQKFKVDRKVVTDQEREWGLKLLARFNERNGSALGPFTSERGASEHLKPIICRIRENPDLTLEELLQVIDRNFANPWWGENGNKRAGSPMVIFSPNVFARALAQPDRPAGKRSFEAERRTAPDEETPW